MRKNSKLNAIMITVVIKLQPSKVGRFLAVGTAIEFWYRPTTIKASATKVGSWRFARCRQVVITTVKNNIALFVLS